MHNIKRAAVLGWPVKHSLSPRLHRFWISQYNINGSYEAIAVEPEQLERALKHLASEGYAGVNLTLPHKETALVFMDEVDAVAKRIGAVNTVSMQDRKLWGRNTDVYGFMENVRKSDVQLAGRKAIIFGAGGAARAICVGLMDEGAHVTIINRTQARAESLANDLGGHINVAGWNDYSSEMKNAALVVNTTSLGMEGQEKLDISLATLSSDAAVADIVYRPLMTPLLVEAKVRGHTIIDGLGMLLYQAQPAFEAWFGVKPAVTEELRQWVIQ